MDAETINASIAETSHGAYIFGRTLKEWIRIGKFYVYDSVILDDEMYFVNEHGVWLVE